MIGPYRTELFYLQSSRWGLGGLPVSLQTCPAQLDVAQDGSSTALLLVGFRRRPFVSHSNYRLPLWFSFRSHPQTIGCNALLQSWTGWSVYAFPPIGLLHHHRYQERLRGGNDRCSPSLASERLVLPTCSDGCEIPF